MPRTVTLPRDDDAIEMNQVTVLCEELAAVEGARFLDNNRALHGVIRLVAPTLRVTSLLPPDEDVLLAGADALHHLHQAVNERIDDTFGLDRELSEMREFVLHGFWCLGRPVRMTPHCLNEACVQRVEKCKQQLLDFGLAQLTEDGLLVRNDDPTDGRLRRAS